jgi:hypothetical protein
MRMTANTWRPATPPPPGGPPPMGWMLSSGNVGYMKTNDSGTAGALLNTPASFCTGISVTSSPVPKPYATTPVLSLASYTNSATATSGGNPDPGLWGDGTNGPNGGLLPTNGIASAAGYKWIAYDNEVQASTPVAESNDPVTYMQAFITACHNNVPSYKVICAPAWGLYTTAALAIHPLNPGETREQWFVRVIVGLGAAGCDLFVLQQEILADSTTYVTVWNDTAKQMAITGAPNALVFGEVSSSQGVTGATAQALGADMVTNAKMLTNPYPNGFYVAMPAVSGETPMGEHQAAGRYFLDGMLAAGYTAG